MEANDQDYHSYGGIFLIVSLCQGYPLMRSDCINLYNFIYWKLLKGCWPKYNSNTYSNYELQVAIP